MSVRARLKRTRRRLFGPSTRDIIAAIKARGHYITEIPSGRTEWHGAEYQTPEGCLKCKERVGR